MGNPKQEKPELPEGMEVRVRTKDGNLEVFNHISLTELGGPGVMLYSGDGKIVGFFTYENLVSVVTPLNDQPKARIVVPTPSVTLQ